MKKWQLLRTGIQIPTFFLKSKDNCPYSDYMTCDTGIAFIQF